MAHYWILISLVQKCFIHVCHDLTYLQPEFQPPPPLAKSRERDVPETKREEETAEIQANLSAFGAHFSGWPTHRVLLGHKGRVTCLLYPHDEYPRYDKEFLVSGGADFSVKLWDIFTGDLLYTFSSHTGELLRLICTPPDCSVRVSVFRSVTCFKLTSLVELLYLFFLESRSILHLFSSPGPLGCTSGIARAKVHYVGFSSRVSGWDDKMASFRRLFGGGLYWRICVRLANGNRWDL